MYDYQLDEYDLPEPSYEDSSTEDLLHDLALARQWLIDDMTRGYDTSCSQGIIDDITSELARRQRAHAVSEYQLPLFTQ